MKVRYKSFVNENDAELKWGSNLDTMLDPGSYTVEIENIDAGVGLPLEQGGNEHYIVGNLVVTDSGTKGQRQENRLIGQILTFTSRKNKDTKIYTRTFSNSIWSKWSSFVGTDVIDNITTTEEMISAIAGLAETVDVLQDEVETGNLRTTIVENELKGTTLAKFDFTTGNIADYANRKFAYKFEKGCSYLLRIVTDENVATTYLSVRVQENTVIANRLLEGTGSRETVYKCEGEGDYLYMSIQSNGVAVVYDVEILNLSKYSISTLVRDNITRDARIDDLTRTLLQLPTTDDFVEGKRLDASGNIFSFSDCSATEKYFYIPAKTKISVKGRIYAGYTFVCVYDANYKAIHILQGQGSNTDVEYTLEYDYSTYIRIAITTSKISDFSISYDGDTVWQDVSNVNNRVTSIENATESLGKPNTLNYEDFEIGYIGIDRTGWSYRDDTDSRVRMKAGITYHLFVGDVVKLPDGVRAYLGYRVGNTYDFKSWVTNEFTIVTEGDYKILLSGVSESTLSSKYDLLTGVRINGGERRYENTLPIDADALATMRVINHRGFNVEAPENTLPAFELSKLKGFRYVEADIRFTADGVAVCLHDDTVDRTSNGSGSVGTMTLEELRALDFGSWLSADYAGVQIPTFEEFIVLCKQLGLKPYIELKAGTAEQIKQLFDLVRLYGMEKHSTFISFNLSLLQMVIDNSDKVRIGLLADTYSEEYLNELISLKGDKRDVFAALNGNAINDEVIMTIRQNGCDVESFTAPWSGFILKVDGVTTDSKLYWDYSGSSSVWRSKTNGWKE